MQNVNPFPTDAVSRVLIGKTVYEATKIPHIAGPAWKLVAVKGSKQEKSLFYSPSSGDFTLWSRRNGIGGCGMPKPVNPQWMGQLSAV